jgi:carboxypeptidase D
LGEARRRDRIGASAEVERMVNETRPLFGRSGLLAVLVTIAVIATAGSSAVRGAGHGEPGPVFPAEILLFDEDVQLEQLYDLRIDVDAVGDGRARVWLLDEEMVKLRALGFDVTVLPNDAPAMAALAREEADAPVYTDTVPATYHTYATLTADLQTIAADHPEIARLYSIGRTVQGRELWMMKISANPDVEEFEPEFAYIAAMHGDEVVGKELVFNLIDYLTDNYGTDPRVTALVDTVEISIMPSMNPDGTELGQRYNAEGYDLNRNFPDPYSDPNNTPDGRPPEIGAVMVWAAGERTSLSANMHCGELIANYPFDNNATGSNVYTATPDDGAAISVSRSYADNNPALFANNSHASFDNGICNGADWYAIDGGMQDWNYVYRGNMQVTLEISATDWPPGSQLPGYWDDNLEAMLSYMERVREGVSGVVTDVTTGQPLDATVHVEGNPYPVYTDPALGDYHRVLLPGAYTLEVSAVGYATKILDDVVVPPGVAVRYDAALEPLDVNLQPVDACVDGGPECREWLAPGETGDVAMTLRNLGLPATTVGARLEPTGWFAEVTRPHALYPDLAPGASGQSAAPHHEVRVDGAVPPGHRVGFVARWESDQGAGLSDPIFLPVSAPQCTLVDSTDVPTAIKDHLTMTSVLDIATDFEISSATVFVDVTHGYVGDLRIDLVSPSGTPVALHNRTGGSTDDIYGTYGVDLTPDEPFSRLRGETGAGTWTLRLRDGVTENQGRLDAWSLELCGRPIEAETPEMRLRDVDAAAEGVRLRWWPYPGLHSYRVYRSTDPSSPGAFVDVTAEDVDPADTAFTDASTEPVVYWLVTGVGPQGEGPKGHFGE